MAFTETLLDLGIDYGTTVTLNFQTQIIEQGDGKEQRIMQWDQPLLSFSIGNRNIGNSDLELLQEFLDDRQGSWVGFRFKDWSDYQLNQQPIGIGDNETQSFQLFKTYSVGGQSVNRPIFKPVPGTLKVFIEGVEIVSGWSVSLSTGLVTFDSPPTGTITVSGEFDVPVRFVEDRIDFKFEAIDRFTGDKIFELSKLTLIEIRLVNPLPVQSPPSNLNHVFVLDYDYETVGGQAYNTTITSVGAGFESRSSNWTITKGTWDIGQRKVDRAQLDYFIALFRVCRGRYSSFRFKDWSNLAVHIVRFSEDVLNFRFEAIELENSQEKDVAFDFSGIAIKKIIYFQITEFSGVFNNQRNGEYNFTINAPSEFDGLIPNAYLIEAQADDNARIVGYWQYDLPINTLWTGSVFVGSRNSIIATAIQLANGPCFFSGKIEWEI